MRKILTYLILAVASSVSFGQDSAVVEVNVVDKRYEDPLQNVTVTVKIGDSTFYRKTGTKGLIRFKTVKGVGINFGMSHAKYNGEREFRRIPVKERADTVEFTFTMQIIRTQEYNEIVVSAPGVPQTVYKSSRLHVEDFEIEPDGQLVLLTYPKRLKKGSELILYDGLKTLNSFQVPGTAEELIRDYRGNPRVICDRNVYGIHVDNSNIAIATLEKDYYLKYIAPIVDTNHTKMYFSTFNPDYPAFEYFAFDQLDSTYTRISGIQDDLMMELYRSEYKWADVRTKLWAKNLELQTGIDAEIYVGANYFTQSIYYKELYAPMFHRNDSLFVFDYYKDQLYTYDTKGNPIDSVAIYHHYQPKKSGWKKQLIQDRKTGQIYALFDRAGFTYIGWVDTDSGEITQHVKLEKRYVKKVAIHNNFVYYVHRPFESAQKKYLWKERLPYDFGKAQVPYGDD